MAQQAAKTSPADAPLLAVQVLVVAWIAGKTLPTVVYFSGTNQPALAATAFAASAGYAFLDPMSLSEKLNLMVKSVEQDELETLPLRAIVALAARVALRVRPFHNESEMTVIDAALSAAAGRRITGVAIKRHPVANQSLKSSYEAIEQLRQATETLLRNYPLYSDDDMDGLGKHIALKAAECIERGEESMPTEADCEHFLAAVRNDFDNLTGICLGVFPSDGHVVDPTDFDRLPLWPGDGTPSWWQLEDPAPVE